MYLPHWPNFILEMFCEAGFSMDVSVWMLGRRIRPISCESSCEFCLEPSGSPALGFQDSMSTLGEAVTKLPMVCACL